MLKRQAYLVALLAAALVAASPSHSLADDMETADVQVQIKASPLDSKDSLERGEIFRILQGGVASSDVGLCQHLWQVAGSLAERGWKPPKVTVRMVVPVQDARD